MRGSLLSYCAQYHKEELLLQWDPIKNGLLTPEKVSYGSHKKIWWKCNAGHEWISPVYARFGKNAGCPFCAGKRVTKGTDLLTLYPEIATQWHPTKNALDRPDQFSPGSRKVAWWKCDAGHEWSAMIKTRVSGSNCPVCANKVVIAGENDLLTKYPNLALQWNSEKNGSLQPNHVSSGSRKKVWWICECGHEWQASVYTRTAGKGCPVCAGTIVIPGENDLQTLEPEISASWNTERNGDLTPQNFHVSSNKRVWWKCAMGHEWQSTVSARTARRSGCPYCAGRKVLSGFNDLKTLHPLIAAQWHPTRNGTLEPSMVTAGSSKKVWWKCVDGHEWRAIIYSRTGAKRCGCPVCAGKTRYDCGSK